MATKESQMKKSKVSNFWDGARNIGSNLVKDAKAIGGATGRHIGGGIIQFVSDIMPGGQSIIEALPDVFSDVKKAYQVSQSTIEKEAKSILRLPTYRGILDWYTAKEDSMGGLMGDVDSELNFDVGESSVTSGSSDESPDNSAADELTAEFKIADKASDKISATVIETSKKNAELQVATLASITNALDKTNSIITAGFDNLNKSIGDLTKIVTDNTAAIIKILEIGKQLDQENASRSSNNDTLTYADLLSGRFDIKKYAKTIGNKFNEKLGMLDMFTAGDGMVDKRAMLLNIGLSFIPGLSDLDISSPKEMVKWGLDKLTDAFLPDLRKGLASIDTGITKWIQQTVLDLGQGFFMGQKIQGDFWNNILELFGIGKESGRLKQIEKNDFEHKQISFDTETKESIVKVIPAYLEKITNALTGESLHYDLKQRKLRKKSEIQASYLQERKEKLEYNINFSEYNQILKDSLAGTQFENEVIDLENATEGEMNLLFLKLMKRLYTQIITGYNSTEEILADFGKTEREICDNISKRYLGFEKGMESLTEEQKKAVIKLAHMIAAIIQQPDHIKTLTKNAFNYQRDINDLQAETNKFYENQNALDIFDEVDNPEKEEEFFKIANEKLNKLLYRKKKFDTVLSILRTLDENPSRIGTVASVKRLKDNLKSLWNNDLGDDANLKKIFNDLENGIKEIGNDSIKNSWTGESFTQKDFQTFFIDGLKESSALKTKTLSDLDSSNKDKKANQLIDAFQSYLYKIEDDIEEERNQSIERYVDKNDKNAKKGLRDLAENSSGTSGEIKNVQFEVTFPEQFKTGFENLADHFKSILVGNESKSFTEIFNDKANEGLKQLENIYKLIDEKQFSVIVQRINKQANEPKTEPKNISSVITPVQPTASKDTYNTNLNPQLEEIFKESTPVKESIELINPEKEVLTKEGLNFATINDNYSNDRKIKIRNKIRNYLQNGKISNDDLRLINIKEFTPERVNALAAKYNIDKKSIPSDTNLVSKPVSVANSSKVEQSKGAQSIQDGVKKLFSVATGGGGGSQAASEAVNQIVKGSIDMVAEPVIKPMQESLKPIGQHINATIFGGTFEEKVVDSKGNVKTVVKKVPEGGLLGFAQEKVGNFFKNLIPSEDKINKVNKDVAKQAKRFASNFKSKDKNGKPIPGTFDWEGLVGRIVGGLGGGALAGPIGSIIGVMVGNLLPIAPIGNAIKNFVVGDLFDKHADPKNPKMGFFEKVFFNWFIPFKTEFGKTMKFLFANVKRNIIGPFLTFGAGIGALFKNGFKGIGQMPWFKSLSNWWKNTPIGKGFKWLGDKVSGFFRMFFGGIGRLITGGLARLFGGLTRGVIGAGTGVVGAGGGIINSILGAIGGKEVREAMKRQNQLNTAAYNRDLSKNGLLSISGAIGELLRGNTGYVKRMFTDKDSVDWWWSNASEIKREREGWLNTRATIRDLFTGGNEAAEALPPKTKAEEAQIDSAKTLRAIANNQGVKLDNSSKSEKASKDEKAKQEAQIKEQKEKKQAGDAIVSATVGHLSDNLMDAVRNGDMTIQEAETHMNKAMQHVPENLKGGFKTARLMGRAASMGIRNAKKTVAGWWENIKGLLGPILSTVGAWLQPFLAPLATLGGILLGINLLQGLLNENSPIYKVLHNIFSLIPSDPKAKKALDNINEETEKFTTKEAFKGAYISHQTSKANKWSNNVNDNQKIQKIADEHNAANAKKSKELVDEEKRLYNEQNNPNKQKKVKKGKNKNWRNQTTKPVKAKVGNNPTTVDTKILNPSEKITKEMWQNALKQDAHNLKINFEETAGNMLKEGAPFRKAGKDYIINASKGLGFRGTIGALQITTTAILRTFGVKDAELKGAWVSLVGGSLFIALKFSTVLALINGIKNSFLKAGKFITDHLFKNVNKSKLSESAGKWLASLTKGLEKFPLNNFFKLLTEEKKCLRFLDWIFNAPAKIGSAIGPKIAEAFAKCFGVNLTETMTTAATAGISALVIGIGSGIYGGTIGFEDTFEVPFQTFEVTGVSNDLKNSAQWISGWLSGIINAIPFLSGLELIVNIINIIINFYGVSLRQLIFGVKDKFFMPENLMTFRGLLAWFFLNLINKNNAESLIDFSQIKTKFYEMTSQEHGLTEWEKHSTSTHDMWEEGFLGRASNDSRHQGTAGLLGQSHRNLIKSKDGKRLFKKGTTTESLKNKYGRIDEDLVGKQSTWATNQRGEMINWTWHFNKHPEEFWVKNFGIDLANPENIDKNNPIFDNDGNIIGYALRDNIAHYAFNPFINYNGDIKKYLPWFTKYIDDTDDYLFYRINQIAQKYPRFYGFLNPHASYENGITYKGITGEGNKRKFIYKPGKYPPGVNANSDYSLENPIANIKKILFNYYKKYPNVGNKYSFSKIFQLALLDYWKEHRNQYQEKYFLSKDEESNLIKYLKDLGDVSDANNADLKHEKRMNALYQNTKTNLSKAMNIGMGEGYSDQKNKPDQYYQMMKEDPDLNTQFMGNKYSGEFREIYIDYWRLKNYQAPKYYKNKNELIDAYRSYKNNQFYKNRAELVRSNRETQASNAQASAKVATQSSKSNNKDVVKAKIATKAEAGKDSTVNSSKVAEAEKTMEAVANPAPEGSLVYPITNYKSFPITSPFGPRWGKFHKGIDLGIPERTPLLAMADGIVTGVGYEAGGYGHWITYKIPSNGLNVIYGHLCEQPKVSKGTAIKKGQIIALSGNTGHSTGPHLHLEIRKGQPGSTDDWNSSQPMNPEQVLEGLTSVAGFNAENSGTAGTANGSSSKTGGILGWLQNSTPYGSLLKWLGSIFTGSQESSSSENTSGGVSSAGAANMSIAANDANREKIYKMLRNKGYSPEAAIGILANIEAESSYRTNVLSYDGEGSIGICQWTYGRRTNLENFARKKGKPVSDLETQVEYLITELEGPYKGVNALKNTNDYGLMAEKFCRDFEVPANVEVRVGERRNMASKLAPILMKLENEPTGSTQISMTNIATQYGMAGGLGDSLADLNPFKSIQNSFNNLDTSSITSKITPQLPGLTNINPDQPLSTTVSQTKAVTKDKNIEEKMDIMIAIFTQILQLVKQGNNINSTGNGFLESMMNMSNAEKQKVLDKIREKQRNSSNHYSPNIYPSAIVGFVKGY